LKRFLPLSLLVLVATAPEREPLTVTDVWARYLELDGKLIRVKGVVTNCKPRGCMLEVQAGDTSKWLGIGASRRFDQQVQRFLGKPIIVEARLDTTCLRPLIESPRVVDGQVEEVVCVDRVSMLREPVLIGRAR
jgi:hypothetical protein